jgi:predicted transcriptional regulator
MAEAETALQMAERHVAEQEIRVLEQENLIVRLRSEGRPRDQAEGMLVEMRNLLDDVRDHLERLRQKPQA